MRGPMLTASGWVIAACVTVLTGVGVASIYVLDTAYVAGHDGPANAARQAAVFLVSGLLGALVIRAGHQRVGRIAYPLFILGAVALVPLFIAKLLHTDFGGLTTPRTGAYRWYRLPGFAVQPSEIMKLAHVLALAWYLRFRDNYRSFGGLLVPLLASLPPIALILLEPDLSAAVLMTAVLFIMLFAAGARMKHLVILMLLGAAAAPLAWWKMEPYQKRRISAVALQLPVIREAVVHDPQHFAWLATPRDVIEWSGNAGYQLLAARRAIASGGVEGYGWGEGVYVDHLLLPDRHNDFIFAMIAHQWGFIGCAVVLTAFGVLVYTGMRIAAQTVDPFARLLAVGLSCMFGLQAMINVAMTVGLMPTTGVPLPFVSDGRSSLVIGVVAAALLISVSRHRPFILARRPFEYGRRRERAHLAELGAGGPVSSSQA